MANWTELKKFNTRYMTTPVQINHDEFIVIGANYNEIFRYSISKNEIVTENINSKQCGDMNLKQNVYVPAGFMKNDQVFIYVSNGAKEVGLYDVSKRIKISESGYCTEPGVYPDIIKINNKWINLSHSLCLW